MSLEEAIELRKDIGPNEEANMRVAHADAGLFIDRYGFGGGMQNIQRVAYERHGNGAFMYGPCVGGAVLCGCSYREFHEDDTDCEYCDWCNGAGWLTRHVREVQIAHNKAES